MRFVLDIACDNAAFTSESGRPSRHTEARALEVARILRNLADRLENLDVKVILRDLNGNRVGSAEFVDH